MKPIHTFGDSHAQWGWQSLPNVIIHSYGPRTMFSLGRDAEILVRDVPPEGIAVFCYGEVDCRCHVNKYQPWEENIDGLVAGYLRAIALNAQVHKGDIWIFNVPPPPRRDKAEEIVQFPFVGTDEERLSYVKYMNEKLKAGPYPFVDIYDSYADADGFLLMQYSDGHVHIIDDSALRDWVDVHR